MSLFSLQDSVVKDLPVTLTRRDRYAKEELTIDDYIQGFLRRIPVHSDRKPSQRFRHLTQTELDKVGAERLPCCPDHDGNTSAPIALFSYCWTIDYT